MITNTAKPTTSSLVNNARVVNYETWDTNTSTWDTETRTWDQMGASMSNTSRPSASSMINTPKP